MSTSEMKNLNTENIIKNTFSSSPQFEHLKGNVSFYNIQQAVKANPALANEYLNQIQNTLNKIYYENYIQTKHPILKTFINITDDPYGDYRSYRQIGPAVLTKYSEQLRLNDNYKPKVYEEVYGTVFKDEYKITLSAEIVQGAMLNVANMNNFISMYWQALTTRADIEWYNRITNLLQNIPDIIKIDNETIKNGKKFGSFLLNLIKNLQVPNDKLIKYPIPTMLQPDDMIIVLNNDILTDVQIETIGAIFNSAELVGISTIKNIIGIRFNDNKTLGVIAHKNSFKLEYRINTSTSQQWAQTLTNDRYTHQWIRVWRNGFLPKVRIVNESFNDKRIDPQKSVLTHYKEVDGKNIPFLDEEPIRDLTNILFKNNYTTKLKALVDIQNFLPTLSPLPIVYKSDTPEVDEIKKAIKQWDILINTDNMNIKDITKNTFTVSTIGFDYMEKEFIIRYQKIDSYKQKKNIATLLNNESLSLGQAPVSNDDDVKFKNWALPLIQKAFKNSSDFIPSFIIFDITIPNTIIVYGVGEYKGEAVFTYQAKQ